MSNMNSTIGVAGTAPTCTYRKTFDGPADWAWKQATAEVKTLVDRGTRAMIYTLASVPGYHVTWVVYGPENNYE